MIRSKKNRKHRQTRFKIEEEKKGNDRFSIEELLDEPSIEKIDPPDLGRRNSRRDLGSQSPEQWGDTSKENINILIMSDPKEVDLFDPNFHL